MRHTISASLSRERSPWKTILKWWEGFIDRPLRPDTLVHNRYLILKILGMGSYGITYLCKDKMNGIECVLKQVKPSKRKGNKGYPIYQRETKILRTLNHPSIPKLYHAFEDRTQLFFTMEYVEGATLEEYIFDQEGSFTEEEALCFLNDVLDIIRYIHDQGLVHRDVRIPNVIKGKDRLYLIDFGLARYLGESPTSMAESLGEYPLEKQLKREVEFKSDFYAMGHFLLFLLYSTFDSKEKPPGTWEEELVMSQGTRVLIKRLLQIDSPYENDGELQKDLESAIQHIRKESLGHTMGTF